MKRWVVVKRPLIEVTGFGDARSKYRPGDVQAKLVCADPQDRTTFASRFREWHRR